MVHPRMGDNDGEVTPATPVVVEHFSPAPINAVDTPGRRPIRYAQRALEASDQVSQHGWQRRWMLWPRAWSTPYAAP